MSAITAENKTPAIRFKGFSGEWDLTHLKDVSTYSNGGSFESNVKEEGKYELVTLKSVDMKGNLVSSGRYIDVDVPTLKKDTLVMILSEQSPGLLGMTAQIPVNEKYVLNQRVAEIQPLENIESYFLSMTINRNQRYFSQRGAGTKVQNISKPSVENYEFLTPQKQEQTQIGALFQQLDRLIAQHQQKHDKLLTVKKSLLEKMFPQPGETQPAIRFKGFSDAWEEKALGDYARFRRGSFPQPYGNKEWYDGIGSLPFVQVVDVTDKLSLVNDTKQKISTIAQTKSVFVEKGKVLVTLQGSIGRVAITHYDAYVDRTILIFEGFENRTDLNYWAYVIQNKFDLEKKKAPGGTIKTITKEALSSFQIKIPVLKEQTKIGQLFQQLDTLINQHQTQLSKLNHVKQSLLAKMFV